jgi:hypothetical protein
MFKNFVLENRAILQKMKKYGKSGRVTYDNKNGACYLHAG